MSKQLINQLKKSKTPVLVFDVTIEDGVNFKHKWELFSNEYFMTFSIWSPTIKSGSVGQKRSISPFCSWYLMRKHLFIKGKQGGITCQGDYMDEKLSAYSRKNQQIALNTIQVAYENNNYHNGVITQKVKKSGVNTVLLGKFDILGEIVFIDSVMHPDMPKYADNCVPVCGRNAYPWAAKDCLVDLMKEYKLGKPPKSFSI